MSFSQASERTGGLISPDFSIAGLSRANGPFGHPGGFVDDVFDPHVYFDKTASVFGDIPLSALLDTVDPQTHPTELPVLHRSADGAVLSITWHTTRLKDVLPAGFEGEPTADDYVLLTQQGGSGLVPIPDQPTTLTMLSLIHI